jgi:hypothetical protein
MSLELPLFPQGGEHRDFVDRVHWVGDHVGLADGNPEGLLDETDQINRTKRST